MRAPSGIGRRRLPDAARAAWERLTHALATTIGDDLVAVWAHGGTTAIDDPPHRADLDTYVIVARRPNEATAEQIDAAQDALAAELGVEWDTWVVVEADARRSEPPRHAFREGRRDTSWAIHRAHWLARRALTLHGRPPDEIVATPTWPELEAELDRELEHIERHVAEGDTDPFEATYATLNGCRIRRGVTTRDVVISKRAAGEWALEHLPDRWHAAIRAAIRTYDGNPLADDARLLATEMAPFVAFVRAGLPPTDGRAADAPPRWSGY